MLNAGTDARGRPRKSRFGSWMLPVFRILSRLKGLRGTAFDVFGHSADRRLEQELIVEFECLLDRLLPELTAGNLAWATELLGLFMNIRGYGPVKEEATSRVRQQIAQRMQNMDSASVDARIV